MALGDVVVSWTAKVARPLWGAKGVVRIAKAVNDRFHPNLDKPVRYANMLDGSRFRVDLRAGTEYPAFYSGRLDDYWVNLGADLLEGSGTYLDVGANVGFYGIRVALRRTTAGKVLCFEPMPGNLRRLEENIALNRCEARVRVFPFGLSDVDHEVRLSFSGDHAGGTGNAEIAPDGDIACQVVRLDDHQDILGDRRVSVVKVDIEGHEPAFFRGATSVLARDRPYVIAELCRDFLARDGVTAEYVYRDCLPADYLLFRARRGRLVRAEFADIARLENILLCPVEKADRLG